MSSFYEMSLKTEGIEQKPSLFNFTAYRLPSSQELEEINSFENLSAQEILNGFGYTIVGRGMLNEENIQKIRTAVAMLCEKFPNNPKYQEVKKLADEKYQSKKNVRNS
jgi:hypothetical protein